MQQRTYYLQCHVVPLLLVTFKLFKWCELASLPTVVPACSASALRACRIARGIHWFHTPIIETMMAITPIGTVTPIAILSEWERFGGVAEVWAGDGVVDEAGAAARVLVSHSYKILVSETYFVSAKYCSDALLVDLRLLSLPELLL
jgi:hypothetical protein